MNITYSFIVNDLEDLKEVHVFGIEILVPVWVNWVAVDSTGELWGYATQPECEVATGVWMVDLFTPLEPLYEVELAPEDRSWTMLIAEC